MRHFIEENSGAEMPPSWLRLRDFLGHIISAATSRAPQRGSFLSGIPCRCARTRKKCSGLIAIQRSNDADPFIYWACTACEENGRIDGYRDCIFDLHRYAVQLNEVSRDAYGEISIAVDEYGAWIVGDIAAYDRESLRLIYAARVEDERVILSGFESEFEHLGDATAADSNHEKKRARRVLIESISDKIFDALRQRRHA